MPITKTVSSEPLFTVRRQLAKRTKTEGNAITVALTRSGEKYQASFSFGDGLTAMFGEKYLVFSSLTDEKRIYFKFDDDGYKCSHTNRFCRCLASISEKDAEKFRELWAGKRYELNKERTYFYIEREDPLEALFKEEIDNEDLMVSAMQSLKRGKKLPKKKPDIQTPNFVWMSPMPESGIQDKKVLAILSRMREKGYISLTDLRSMNMTDREYYQATTDLITTYGYALVDVPCINDTGKKFFVKALYNGTGEWE